MMLLIIFSSQTVLADISTLNAVALIQYVLFVKQ